MGRRRTKRPKETAEYFATTTTTLRSWATARDLPCDQEPGKPRRYNLAEVQEWLEEHGLRPPGQPKAKAKGPPTAAAKAAGKALAAARAKGKGKGKAKPEPEAPTEIEEAASMGLRSQGAEVRRKEAQAELAELELASKRGELVNVADVNTRIHQAIEAVKVAMLGMGRKYSAYLEMQTAAEIRVRMDEIGREILSLFSGNLDPEPEPE